MAICVGGCGTMANFRGSQTGMRGSDGYRRFCEAVEPGVAARLPAGPCHSRHRLLGFSLSFVRFWNFEHAGEWTWGGVIPACIVAAGIGVQIVALYRSLELLDDEPTRYAATVRCFFVGIVVVVVGVVIATIAA